MEAKRIGIDFGNTIGKLEDTEAALFSFEIIRHFVSKHIAGNVFIVLKAGQEIRGWLNNPHSYEATGFLRSNVIFVRCYVVKAVIIQALDICTFFDNSCIVVKVLTPLEVVEKSSGACMLILESSSKFLYTFEGKLLFQMSGRRR